MGVTEPLADREHVYRGAPRAVIFRALTDHRVGWLRRGLHPGEVVPGVLVSIPDERVVWSSFWPTSPGDTIEFTLSESRGDTTLRLQWFSSTPPDERGSGSHGRRSLEGPVISTQEIH